MARQARIVLVGGTSPANERLVEDLRAESLDVAALSAPVEAESANAPDLVLIDATAQADVTGAVRACREQWPEQTTPVLVLGSPDPTTSAAAIDAGATDSLADTDGGPLMAAHVRRLLRASESLRSILDDERRRVKRESLALAAADVAVPLGALLDELEAIMLRAPVDEPLDELLDLTARAVDAVDRLRLMATNGEAAVDANVDG